MSEAMKCYVNVVARNKELLDVCNGDKPNGNWLGVDLDGTLAQYHGWVSEEHIGEPVVSIVAALNARRAAGWKIVIFTARVSGDSEEAQRAEVAIWKWLDFYNIKVEGITCTKHKHFAEFWDDRARRVVFNKGIFAESLLENVEGQFIPSQKELDEHNLVDFVDPVGGASPSKEHNPEIGCSLDTQIGGNHYKDMVIQPAEYCEYNNIPALESAVIKYVSRHQSKNGVQDLEKAKDLINMIIEMRYEPTGLNHLAARINSKRHNKFEGK